MAGIGGMPISRRGTIGERCGQGEEQACKACSETKVTFDATQPEFAVAQTEGPGCTVGC